MSEIETGFRTLATLMRLIADVDRPLDAKIRSGLGTAADTPGFPIAYFTRIDDRSQHIVVADAETEGWAGAPGYSSTGRPSTVFAPSES